MIRAFYTIILCLIIQIPMPAQWSTSTLADSSLSVCPGIHSRILPLSDGSSIIIGRGDEWGVWMQKLDPYGFKQWHPWVTVSNAFPQIQTFVPDGNGGAFAIIGETMQCVNADGTLRFPQNGIPIFDGGVVFNAIEDGAGGFIALYESTGGTHQRVGVTRYSGTGVRLWNVFIDSVVLPNRRVGQINNRLGSSVLIRINPNQRFRIDTSGYVMKMDSLKNVTEVYSFEGDSVLFVNREFWEPLHGDSIPASISLYKLNCDWDTVWSVTRNWKMINAEYFYTREPFLHNYNGSVFWYASYREYQTQARATRIHLINENGIVKERVIQGHAGRYFFASPGRLGFLTDDGYALSVNDSLELLWGDNFRVISNPNDANYIWLVSDYHGGGIISFWNPTGGVHAHHTGRNGKVGVLTRVNNDGEGRIPGTLLLHQNYPNPFNPVTTIAYSVPADGPVTLKVYDLLGREVSVLINGFARAGEHTASFDALHLSSGVYYCRLSSGLHTAVRKMVLQR